MITGDRQDTSQEQRRRSKELGKRWADAYDCWVNPPGADEPIYLCPQDSDAIFFEQCEGDGRKRLRIEKNQSLPQEILNLKHPIYGITASNPMGNDQSDDLNEKLNRLLQDDFVRLRAANNQGNIGTDTDKDDRNTCRSGPRQPTRMETSESREIINWWHSFGFGESFHEKGFAVSAERDLVDDLARKYQQGAIYEFCVTRTNDINTGDENCENQTEELLPDAMTTTATNVSIVRKTIPILVPDVEADIRMTRCHRPPFATSDPNYCQK